jgi:ferric-dicitrate binding protein FerR (iron transport regulator)
LTQGEISVDLDPTANAYVRAAGSQYASSAGAAFLASVRAGSASITVKTGEVRREEQAGQHQYTIRPVGHGSNIRVAAGGLTRIHVQVLEDEKPVPGVAVLFALDTSGAVIGLLGLGTLSGTTANVVTDSDGMAAVQFVARDSSGTGPISATVEGTRVAWTGQISVTSRSDRRGSKWGIAVIAGAAAAAGIGWALTRNEKDPIEAAPPVVK